VDIVACILAAGTGSRLKGLTDNNTKCMVKLPNGRRIIDTLIDNLLSAGIVDIVVVTGYKSECLIKYLNKTFENANFIYVHNERYSTTNNIFSFKLAIPYLKNASSVVVCESDVWVEKHSFLSFINAPHDNVILVSDFEYWMDGTCVILDEQEIVVQGFVSKSDIHKNINNKLHKTVNFCKLSGEFLNKVYRLFIEAYVNSFGDNAYYEDVFKVIATAQVKLFTAYSIPLGTWMEIDDEDDLYRAGELLADGANRNEILVKRFGGFWKQSEMCDLSLLVTPFFPPHGMLVELQSLLPKVITRYPSSRLIIERILSKHLPVESNMVTLANGASELITVLPKVFPGIEFNIVAPAFKEYARALNGNIEINDRDVFCVTLSESIVDIAHNSTGGVIVVNPNNPTGELVQRSTLINVLEILNKSNRYMILDESFIDFSEDDASLMRKEILEQYHNLIIIKSYGKSFGVPGLRLGIAVSANIDILNRIRSALPIWNISSLAEVFLEILPRYEAQFDASRQRLILERKWLKDKLELLGLHIFPSQANFLLMLIPDNIDIKSLISYFISNDVLLKHISYNDGSSSVANFIRIAIGDRSVNDNTCKLFERYMQGINE